MHLLGWRGPQRESGPRKYFRLSLLSNMYVGAVCTEAVMFDSWRYRCVWFLGCCVFMFSQFLFRGKEHIQQTIDVQNCLNHIGTVLKLNTFDTELY